MRFPVLISILILQAVVNAQTIPYNLTPDWISQPNGQIATGLGLADINGDGFKDLIVANGNDIELQHLTVHYNDGTGSFNINPDWESDDMDYHGHLATGDLDNDGDIDVVVSVYIGQAGFSSPGELKIYYNLGNQLETVPSFISNEFYTFSCALGDADADGDLDIAAVAGEPYSGLLDYGKIFINSNGTFQAQAEWQSDVLMGSLDVEFGDFNRDGYLDLIFVCEGTPNMIYLANEDGIIDESPDWESSEAENYINSVDIGYPEGQCMVVMTENNQLGGDGRVRKYDFGSIIPATGSASWYSGNFGYGSGIMLNDVDLDGYQDLIYGGWWLPVKIALGNGSGFELNTSYTSSTSSVVEAILLADLDRVDEKSLQETFTISSSQYNTNVLILNRPIVESVDQITRNDEMITFQEYKHVPGKPWIVFSDPFQTGDTIVVQYKASDRPDMVITNWDSNKGDYIFYNTESSVGFDEQESLDAGRVSLEAWPVPASDQLAVRLNGLFPGEQPAILKVVEINSLTGINYCRKSWPAGAQEMLLDVSTLPYGLYLIVLRFNEKPIAARRIIISG